MISSLEKNSTMAGLFLIIILVAASIPFQKRIDNLRGKFRSIEETLYFSSSALKKLSLGYRELVADIYWLRALQYFGGRKFKEQNPELLYHYFDIITDLDPNFVNAYRFGGTFLAEPVPIGLGDIEKGMKLFDKGRMNNPDNFRIPLEQGFIAYLYQKDYDRASQLFYEASEKPNLPDTRRASIRGMAASTLSRGGERELSRQIWKNIYENTTSEGRRKFALRNLKELDTKDIEDYLTDLLKGYIKKYGYLPNSLNELVDSGMVRIIPKDHYGRTYMIVDKLKSVRSSTLLNQELEYNQLFLTAKSGRFMKLFGRYPKNLDELREFVENYTTAEFPPHPLGEEYVYNPQSGVVQSQ